MRTKPSLLFVLVLLIAIAASACSGSSAATTQAPTQSPSATPTAAVTPTPQPTEQATEKATEEPTKKADDPLASVDWSKITSYKFSMTMQGPSFDSVAKMFSSNGVLVMSGTIISSPTKSAYVKIGTIEMIQVGSNGWIKMGTAWSPTGSSPNLADSLAPDKMFASFSSGMANLPSGQGIQNLGEGTKNGVTAIHYKVDSSVVAASMASVFGVTGDATWSFDMWVAKDGGYPANMAVIGKTSGKTVAQLIFDITNVNDLANKVEAPM